MALTFPLGTQIEIPVSLKKHKLDRAACSYEAVHNSETGVNTVLDVRVPVDKGEWDAATAYSAGDEVSIGLAIYTLKVGTAVVSAVSPGLSTAWKTAAANTVYIQIPKTLVEAGTIELAATETSGAFPQILKIYNEQITFTASPTELV
jgi:hypothetical protein